jgi:hypothetical protein
MTNSQARAQLPAEEGSTDDASPRSGTPPPAASRWKPGQSGNPGGRPKGRSVTSELRDLLDNEHNGKRLAAIIAELIMKGALQGKLDYLREIIDRTEGKAPAMLEVQATVLSFVVHVPGPEIIGQAAHDKAVEEAHRKCPPGAKLLVGDLWMNV